MYAYAIVLNSQTEVCCVLVGVCRILFFKCLMNDILAHVCTCVCTCSQHTHACMHTHTNTHTQP